MSYRKMVSTLKESYAFLFSRICLKPSNKSSRKNVPSGKSFNECIHYQMEQKAEEQARQNVLSKKKKAMQERIAKERAQKENMKK